MANFVLQELPEEMSEGKKIVFPKMQTYSLHDYDTVIKHMRTYAGSISDGLIRAVLDALVSTMQSWMPLGHSIKIDGLGVFSLSLGFDTSTPSEKAISKEQDNENPKVKEMNKQATFDRVSTEIVAPKKCKYSQEERLGKAKAIISKYGYMTLSDYALATDQSRSAASNDLKRLVADADSGITTRGSHSHKVWIATKG